VRQREGQVPEREADDNHHQSRTRHADVNFEMEKNGGSQTGGHGLERNAEKGVNRIHAKTFDFLKEVTDILFKDGSKTDWTSQQLVSEWLRLLPTLSGGQQRDALRLADISARDMIQGPREIAFAQRTLELIRAWTRVGDASSANSLLECLVEAYGQLDEPTIVHDIALAYSSVITAWGNDRSDEGSLARAITLFKTMENPPVEAYNGVLNAYGNRGLAIEATKFFRDMQANSSVRADSISFGTLMKAWTRSQSQDAQHHIDNLLEELKELYEAEGCPIHLMPNAVMFAIAMTLAPPERATALLQEMCSMYEANRIEQLAPNVGHYMLAMRSWAKAGNPQEAERLLGELTSAYRGGNDRLQPGHEVSIRDSISIRCSVLDIKLTYNAQNANLVFRGCDGRLCETRYTRGSAEG
jgi:pentatricopeptide repeat protein